MGDIAKACMDGDVIAVKTILEEAGSDSKEDVIKTPVKWTDKEGEGFEKSPIFIAVDYGHLEILRVFLETGADVISVKDENDYTPLHWACSNGQIEIVKILFEHGAEVDDEGLSLARDEDHKEVVKFILEHIDLYKGLEADVDAIMEKACREGDLARVQKLMEEGYDCKKWMDDEGKYHQFSPMFMALKYGHFEIIQLFTEAGVEIDAQDVQEGLTDYKGTASSTTDDRL